MIVREAWDGNEWCVSFRISLHGELVEDWENLKRLLREVQLDLTRDDEVKWVIDKSNVFTSKSPYYAMIHEEVRDQLSKLLWRSKVYLKVKNFLW